MLEPPPQTSDWEGVRDRLQRAAAGWPPQVVPERPPAAPLVMLIASKDHRLFYEAYNDASDIDGDGVLDNSDHSPEISEGGYTLAGSGTGFTDWQFDIVYEFEIAGSAVRRRKGLESRTRSSGSPSSSSARAASARSSTRASARTSTSAVCRRPLDAVFMTS